MGALLGVFLFGAAASLFVLFRVVLPDRPDETVVGELTAQLACVLITGLIAAGAAALIDFALRHDSVMGYIWLAAALAATIAFVAFANRVGRKPRIA